MIDYSYKSRIKPALKIFDKTRKKGGHSVFNQDASDVLFEILTEMAKKADLLDTINFFPKVKT